MSQEYSDYGISIPIYAMRIRILLVNPNMASLMHTTSILEEATYKVTSAEFPSVALKMMQERANKFDLVIAAMDMLEMDGFTFLKIAKMVSDHPVVCDDQLTTYKKHDPLAFEAIERGACELCTKPIKREDAQYFWQYVFRKDRNKTHTDIRKQEKIVVGASRHTENNQNNQKRKRVQYGNEKTLNSDTETSTGRIQYKKIIRWNTGIHAKFMKALMKSNEEAIIPAQPGPEIAYLAALAQKNKERGDHRSTNMAATPTSASDTIQAQGLSNSTNLATPTSASDKIQVQGLSNSTNLATPTSASDTIQALPDASYAITNAQRSGATPRQQPKNVLSNAAAIRQGYRFLQNHDNVSQIGILNGTSSMNKTSHLFNTSNQLAVNETTGNQSLLRGRIDQNRQAYLTNTGTENTSSIPNLQTETVALSPSSYNRNAFQSEKFSNGAFTSTGELNPSNLHNLQVETTGLLQTPDVLNFNCNNNSLLPSYGLENQAIQPTNDLVGNILQINNDPSSDFTSLGFNTGNDA
ncbi:two-component response regulator ORR26-like [Chenopodium quinoa]|uniref:two-component response regulator ORR26-like n=1 Tax=Chenopodium quinoa TaxID=63459 RepID=UPI000B775C55|nr:two-component response regulator ORR26-like [Chenopodium quinoa]